MTETRAARGRENGARSRVTRVLFVTAILRNPATGGPYLRIENSIKALQRVSQLHVISRAPANQIGGRRAIAYYRRLCHRFSFARSSSTAGRVLNRVRLIVNKLARWYLPHDLFGNTQFFQRDHAGILQMAHAISADVIWLGYGNISYPLLQYLKAHSNLPVVLDTDSVWSRFVLRGLPYAADDAERERIAGEGRAKAAEEEWGTRLANVTTAVSRVDAEYYESMAANPEQVAIFANGIDLDAYRAIPLMPPGFKRPALYLAGTFGPRSPMEDAARWLITEVMPRIRAARDDVHLYIVGFGSKETLADVDDPSVSVVGEVRSVLAYLGHASVALVPLRYESGTRFKILEAGACGIPVVSTTLGAEGIPVRHATDILLADEPADFASAVLRILDDPAEGARMGRSLQQLVQREYGIDTLARQAAGILDRLLHPASTVEVMQ